MVKSNCSMFRQVGRAKLANGYVLIKEVAKMVKQYSGTITVNCLVSLSGVINPVGGQWSIWLMVVGHSWPLLNTKKEYSQIVQRRIP